MIRRKYLYHSLLLIISTFSFILTSCEKDFEWELPLAFTQKNLILSSGTGTTHILVYATKNWNAHFVEKVDWASIDRLSGKENSEIIFSYAANYGVNRKVQLAFETEEHLRDTITLVQSGEISSSDARLIINEQTVETPASTTTLDLELDTNLKYDLYRIRYLVTYSSENPEENWIEEVSYDSEKLHTIVLCLSVLRLMPLDSPRYPNQPDRQSFGVYLQILLEYLCILPSQSQGKMA